MEYNKTIYVDKVTPLDAKTLNKGENAIEQNAKDIKKISDVIVNLDNAIKSKSDKEHVHNEYTTESRVVNLINEAQIGGDVDLSEYATKDYVDKELLEKSPIGHTHTSSKIIMGDGETLEEINKALQTHIHDNIDFYFKHPNPNDSDLLPNVGGVVEPPIKTKEIEITTDSITFLEGTNMTPQVRLSVIPSDTVTLTVVNSNNEIQVAPLMLTFTASNYNRYQAIDVRSARTSSEGDLTSTLTLTTIGGGYDTVASKQISVKMISEGGVLPPTPPPTDEFRVIEQGDVVCTNGDVSISSGKITLNSFSSGYAMICTNEGIVGFEGTVNTDEPHIVLASNTDNTSVVSVYFKSTDARIFKTVNGGVNSSGNLDMKHNQAMSVGDILRITPTEDQVDKIDIHYNNAIQNQISLSELKAKSGISDLHFAFGLISNTNKTLFSNVTVLGGSSDGGEVEPPPIDPPVEGDVLTELIDVDFINTTVSLGNDVEYSIVDNKLCFTKLSSGRATVYTKPLTSIKFEVMNNLDWFTLYSNVDGSKSYGFYAKNPNGFGYVTFNGYSDDYKFSSDKPTFNPILVGDVVEVKYLENGCEIYVNSALVSTVNKTFFVDGADFIPRCGFKIDASITSVPHMLINGIDGTLETNLYTSREYGYGLTQKLEKAIDHIKYLYTQIDSESSTPNPFKGKVASAIGDSITADGSYLNPLKSKLELASTQNLAIGGQGYTGGNFLNQVPSISNNVSLIVLSGGVNDFRVNKPLGTPKDTEIDTFYGALYQTFKKVAELHSNKKVVVVTFHNNKEHVHTMYPAWDKPNSLGVYAWEYIQAMEQRARMFGFPVADVYGESGINVQDHCTTDGIHLNADGGSRMAEIIKDTVLTKPYYRFS